MADTPAKNQQQLRGLLHPIRDKALDELHIEPALPRGCSKGEPIAVN